MSAQATSTRAEPSPVPPEMRTAARDLTGYWWVWLVAGIAWVAAALVILQFDQASVATVGVLVGLMFLVASIENLALATLDVPMRWAWALFGGVFAASAVISFASPTDTFTGLVLSNSAASE